MIQYDPYFSIRLKPPPSIWYTLNLVIFWLTPNSWSMKSLPPPFWALQILSSRFLLGGNFDTQNDWKSWPLHFSAKRNCTVSRQKNQKTCGTGRCRWHFQHRRGENLKLCEPLRGASVWACLRVPKGPNKRLQEGSKLLIKLAQKELWWTIFLFWHLNHLWKVVLDKWQMGSSSSWFGH